MLKITSTISIPDDEVTLSPIRAQGSGGQNVNKVSSAIHLQFDINASSLPEHYKQRLLTLRDRRISKEGVIIIKSQRFRTQLKNREDALDRLLVFIKSVAIVNKTRRPTKATRSSQKKRLDNKTRRGKMKVLRSKVLE